MKAAPTDTLAKVLEGLGIRKGGDNEILVFVGECDEALSDSDEDEGADSHKPVDVGLTLEALELHRHRHVHCHMCSHVSVEVHFGGGTRRHNFSPATTIAVVTQWARKKFRLDAAAAADYVLQIAGGTEQPRPDKHLGELVTGAACALDFDLVTEVTPQG